MNKPDLASIEPAPMQSVIYILDVAERPGIANAIASVFAHRGLSMEAVVADASRNPPRILVVFTGTPRQCRMVEHVLKRLHHVHHVRCEPDNSPHIHAFAYCRALAPLSPQPGIEIQPEGPLYRLTGGYRALQLALSTWRQNGLIGEVTQSLVAL